MKSRSLFLVIIAVFTASAALGQTQLTIKKKMTMKIPGMPSMANLPNGMANPLKDRTSTVYVKGGRMRTDLNAELPGRSGMEKFVQSMIIQCDKRQMINFNTRKKKYHVEPLGGATAAGTAGSRKGGYVTISGGVTDTGERAKLFGYDAKHLKESYTITPGPNSCQKQTLKVEIDGWYADLPEFSCPAQRKPSEFQMEGNCFDDVEYKVTGTGVTGLALKEVKVITVDGMSIRMEEEAFSVTSTPIADSIFEAPANYRAANTLKEVADDSPDDTAGAAITPQDATPQNPAGGYTLSLPKAGVEKPPVGEKQPGMIRIGVLKPKITTPESKNDPDAGADIAAGVAATLVESIKAQNVEAVEIESPADAQLKMCDYTLFANVQQKRGGGFGIGKMMAMSAVMMAGALVPGVGAMIATTVASQVMSQAMMKNAKAKDEFIFDYKVVGNDNAVLAAGNTKKKTEKDGEDVLTPQVQDAAKAILAKVNK